MSIKKVIKEKRTKNYRIIVKEENLTKVLGILALATEGRWMKNKLAVVPFGNKENYGKWLISCSLTNKIWNEIRTDISTMAEVIQQYGNQTITYIEVC